MQRMTSYRTIHEQFVRAFFGGSVKSLWVLLLAGVALLTACGGGSSSSSSSQSNGPLSGNWQFTMKAPSDNSFVGGVRGGFLQQSTGPVTGGVIYSLSYPGQTKCSDNSGSAPVTGSLNGQTVNLTVPVGAQTYTLQGTLSTDGSTMMGTYAVSDGKGCGTAQSGLHWSAVSVPPLTGPVQGSFHSTAGGSLDNQDFAVTGALTQGDNIGASNATITGTLSFPGYPCLTDAFVNGQISGSSVILQIIGSNGLTVGQIGNPLGVVSGGSPAIFESAAGGSILHGTAVGSSGNGYAVTTKPCSTATLGSDIGNFCLALGNATACTEPILLSPAALVFPSQGLGSAATAQTITLTNTDPSGSTLNGLTIKCPDPSLGCVSVLNGAFGILSDFNGVSNFTAQDTCSSSPGIPFSLGPRQSCSITVLFSPQQSCPWLPSGSPPSSSGASPSLCPFPVTASVIVSSPKSADSDKDFAVPVSGTGLSAIVPSTPEIDFGSEAPTERSLPQLLSFTNQGSSAVQILPAATPCTVPFNGKPVLLPRPLAPGVVSGLQVDATISADAAPPPPPRSIFYTCDYDPTGKEPNFQISSDTCTGRVLAPQSSCSLELTYVPQPDTYKTEALNGPGLDYFLELNTLECTSNTTTDCEIDSGRFPVELKANPPSPLRMSPGAGLEFGLQPQGQTSNPLTITLFNDPKDPNSQTVNFTGNLVKGDYAETDDCGASLAPGASCTLTITFTPKVVGFDPGSLTIGYTVQLNQFVGLRGTGQ